ncbi:3-phosphoinositide-dependent protein kinase 1 [Exaiptasia diaphana]|uniref:3-phosphoinositide-dependent protein kinase 1 n=1 Tax=Exaiptasia diaphana TaxID=2652724 RepID=A0A913Y867_EXADI|nr:3-phosphoinositide-dependent protein kinase 1 [Exaiptasia diaphana]KXJ22011.1 3-phosphoinositide-dependent protein kinase 1 [Exaiptasia diaphana]
MEPSQGDSKATPPQSPTSQEPKSPTTQAPAATSGTPGKKRRHDFKFGKILGEGSYSTVFVAQEIATGKEFAIKVLEKRHMIREKKVPQVQREKEVLSRLNHPFFVKLYFTFQDKENLYFGLSYAKRGELLPYINKLGSFDESATQFYSAEIISALEHLHGLGIIHRDLKPENILLDENMHIQITDFGTAKILEGDNNKGRNSFVGTAQYVSPELLNDKRACKSSDIWALGCIIYQLLSGLPPFRAGNEYQIFQKINKLEYEFPSGFPSSPKDLVEKILILDPTKRLGSEECGGFEDLKGHSFYKGVNWEELPNTNPPELLPYLPATSSDGEEHRSKYRADVSDNGLNDFDDSLLARFGLSDEYKAVDKPTQKNYLRLTKIEVEERLKKQMDESPWHQFIENNLIIKTGILDKRKGLFAKRRQMILTEGPHLYYVDTAAMVLKGQIPWTKELRAEAKSFKVFFVHTPIKTYYLEDHKGFAVEWVDKIKDVHQYYFGLSSI